ncbi:Flp pilus assembly complex ATPase component TadA [Candidatus Woesearchaeota archaeon]|nr:Flp pilus assembly complex ATPase component TadA [Candidatus Woesearchaeota archaeon]MBI4154702.1 Flp pilus assembly complex ATPase component TadA [Candidatus Woesearchaeota archaeon]
MENKFVLDTSVVIEKVASNLIKEGKLKGKILIPKAVLAELEHQANLGQEIGFLGLEELQELQKLQKEGIEIEFIGERPNLYQIKFAKAGGEIDSLIRDLAYDENAILVTADFIQAESAKAIGLEVKFIELKKLIKALKLESFFDETTMSVHIKEDCDVKAKKGFPGRWDLVVVANKLKSEVVRDIAKEIVEATRADPKSFVEISRKGSTIVQYKNYRVVITKPPISDGWEITAVRPIKKLILEDYNLAPEIDDRIKTKVNGLIIAGATGSGKSTLAAAICEYYNSAKKITKTVESPRDLVLSDDITQYSKNFTTSQEIHDILFLSRPDAIIFDEMRDTPDFKLFVDLRLAGSMVIGVLHAANAIDAVQRFIGRIDTGIIPSVLDTIIFMDKGAIAKVLILKITVKVPSGMMEADLARPVVEVYDFLNKRLEYEIYSYGEQTVVVPVSEGAKETGVHKLARRQIEAELQKYSDNVKVEMQNSNRATVYVNSEDIARIIGKQGVNIEKLEKNLGISLDVREFEGKPQVEGEEVNYTVDESNKYLIVLTNIKNKNLDFYVDEEYLFSATSSKEGDIRVHKQGKLGKTLKHAIDRKTLKILREV